MLEVNWNPSKSDVRQFAGIWLPLFAALLGAVVAYRAGTWSSGVPVWGIGLGLAAAGVSFPAFGKAMFLAAMAAAYPIGWVVSHLVLAILFYLVVTPIGVIMRIAGRDPLRRTAVRGSYWIPHEPDSRPSSYFRQF